MIRRAAAVAVLAAAASILLTPSAHADEGVCVGWSPRQDPVCVVIGAHG
jgi:hypothetical protein